MIFNAPVSRKGRDLEINQERLRNPSRVSTSHGRVGHLRAPVRRHQPNSTLADTPFDPVDHRRWRRVVQPHQHDCVPLWCLPSARSHALRVWVFLTRNRLPSDARPDDPRLHAPTASAPPLLQRSAHGQPYLAIHQRHRSHRGFHRPRNPGDLPGHHHSLRDDGRPLCPQPSTRLNRARAHPACVVARLPLCLAGSPDVARHP